MKQTDDTKTREIVPLLTPEQIAEANAFAEAAHAERVRAQNAERQRRYKARHAGKQRPIALHIDNMVDFSLQALCVHHGCDRRTMIEALINNAFTDLTGKKLSVAEWDALEKETWARSRKHRVLPK